MDLIVILEFSKRQQSDPIVLSLIGEQPDILLQFLVDLLRLSVSLGVVSGGSSKFHSDEPVEFPHELCYELRTMIRYNLSGQAVMLPDVLERELGSSGCGEGHDSQNEMSSFSDGVDSNHD